MAAAADVAALAELQDIELEKLVAFAEWVAAHSETHLPFVAEIDGYVVAAAWLLVAERVPRNGSLDRRYGDVQSVMVREEWRNQGVGAALMAAGQSGHARPHGGVGLAGVVRAARCRFGHRLTRHRGVLRALTVERPCVVTGWLDTWWPISLCGDPGRIMDYCATLETCAHMRAVNLQGSRNVGESDRAKAARRDEILSTVDGSPVVWTGCHDMGRQSRITHTGPRSRGLARRWAPVDQAGLTAAGPACASRLDERRS
jgi:GNAT superfamily N-acetyltransferase